MPEWPGTHMNCICLVLLMRFKRHFILLTRGCVEKSGEDMASMEEDESVKITDLSMLR